MENAVEKAIRLLGGSLQATIKTGIHGTTLWKWAQAGRIKDGRRAVLVSRATDGQVSVEELVGAASENGENGDKPGRFRRGGQITTTCPAPSPLPSDQPPPVAAVLAA